MSAKLKIQISRSLDDRIKKIINRSEEYQDQTFDEVDTAYILGFHQGNTINFVGLSRNLEQNNANLSNLGLVFFRSSKTADNIKDNLNTLASHSNSNDNNNNLFLIYNLIDDTTKDVEKKIFDFKSGNYLEAQPKLSVLDDNKIYNHSCLVKLNLPIKLGIYDKNKIFSIDKTKESLNEIKNSFIEPTKEINLKLKDSSYSIDLTQANNKNTTEYLYDFLDVPSDVEQMGDYLPHLTKEDKKKLSDKWRNKVKSQRSPLEIDLFHNNLSFNEKLKPNEVEFYPLNLSVFLYIHVNDSMMTTVNSILSFIRKEIDLIGEVFEQFGNIQYSLEPEELKCCTFKPANVGHLVQAIYLIPKFKYDTSFVGNKTRIPDYDRLKELRHKIHSKFIIPIVRPQFRYSQRILDVTMKNLDEKSGFLCNVHRDIAEQSGIKQGLKNIIEGTYTYHHYMQHSFNDNGWGCAYRSLQTIISWFKHQAYICSPDIPVRVLEKAKKGLDQMDCMFMMCLKHPSEIESRVPTHNEIQAVLHDVGVMNDKAVGEKQWIGSQEVCYVLSHLFKIDCKFINVNSGSELVDKARDLAQHFSKQSTPVMIGGGVLAHTIIGLDFNEKNGDVSYLVLDPHYTGGEDLSTIIKKGWCGWKKNSFWSKGSFYNLCLPQRPQNEY